MPESRPILRARLLPEEHYLALRLLADVAKFKARKGEDVRAIASQRSGTLRAEPQASQAKLPAAIARQT